MQVQVGIIPGSGLQTIALGSSATVSDAIASAGLPTEGFTFTVDGIASSLGSVLRDGSRVILSKNAKGNAL